MRMSVFGMLALSMVAAVAHGQNQSPPIAPRAQSPAQDGAQPGGIQNPQPAQGQPGAAQPGQPANPNQAQQQPGNQQRQQPQQRTANFRGEAGSQGMAQAIDGHLAACLILSNEEEVALGKFAGEKASGEKVKKFAKQMVDEHTKAISQLKQFAPQGANLQLTSSGASSSARDQRNPGSRESTNANSSDQVGQQMLVIMRDAKQQCLDMTQKELSERKGEEFDHAYIGQQMGGHVQMIAALTAFEKHASPELQRVVAEQKKTAEQHLDHLKQLVETTKTASHAN